MLAIFAQLVGVQPDEYVLILMVGRLIESWSHANVDMSFGRVGERLLVGPRFHRLHHARAEPDERHIHDHNFAPVFPVWDILFGTAIYDGKRAPDRRRRSGDRCRQRPRLDRPAGHGRSAASCAPSTPRFMRAPERSLDFGRAAE